jgi:hypothetical protein
MQDVKAAESRSQQAPGALVVDLVLIYAYCVGICKPPASPGFCPACLPSVHLQFGLSAITVCGSMEALAVRALMVGCMSKALSN